MLRGILTLFVLLVSLPALAQRDLPKDMDTAVLKKVELPYLVLNQGGFSWTKLLTLGIVDGNSAKLQLTRFTRIHDENDRFIPIGRLNSKSGRAVAFKRNENNLIREIWILTDAEAEQFKAQKTDRQHNAAE